jgi:hypothetical protein
MKIVAWNCNMGFHKKYEPLLALKPDVAIIPECANMELLKKSSPDFKPTSSIWIGDNQPKGLAVFTFGQFSALLSDCYQDHLCPFLEPRFLPRLEHIGNPALVRFIFNLDSLSTPIHLPPTLSRNFVKAECADVARDFDGRMVMPSTIGLPFGDRDDAKLLPEASCRWAKYNAV